MNAELRLSELQKEKVGPIIRQLNNKGAFITASVIGDILGVTATKAEIEQLMALLNVK